MLIGLGGVQSLWSPSTSFSTAQSDSLRVSSGIPKQPRQQDPAATTQPVFRVPILARSSEIPVIGVGFNRAEKRYPMLLDTGASVTVITNEMASELQFQQTSVVRATTGSGQEIEVPFGIVPAIEVGGIRIEQFQVGVGPVPLLGQNFLKKFTYVVTAKDVLLHPHTPSQDASLGMMQSPQSPVQAAPAKRHPQSPVSVPEALSKQGASDRDKSESYLQRLTQP